MQGGPICLSPGALINPKASGRHTSRGRKYTPTTLAGHQHNKYCLSCPAADKVILSPETIRAHITRNTKIPDTREQRRKPMSRRNECIRTVPPLPHPRSLGHSYCRGSAMWSSPALPTMLDTRKGCKSRPHGTLVTLGPFDAPPTPYLARQMH